MIECLSILAEFFGSDNQGITKECLYSIDKYKELKKYLKYQTYDTPRLLSMYYQEMLANQANWKSSEFGVIYVRAFYHTKDEALVIEVFKCRGLMPMDQNGLSDPVRQLWLIILFSYLKT
jgi:hypothetical protein